MNTIEPRMNTNEHESYRRHGLDASPPVASQSRQFLKIHDLRVSIIRVHWYYYLAESSHAAQIFPRRPRPRPRLGVWARLRGRGRRRGRFGCGYAALSPFVVDF